MECINCNAVQCGACCIVDGELLRSRIVKATFGKSRALCPGCAVAPLIRGSDSGQAVLESHGVCARVAKDALAAIASGYAHPDICLASRCLSKSG